MSSTSRKYALHMSGSGRPTSRDMLNVGALGGGIADDLLVSAVMVVDYRTVPLRLARSLQSLFPQTFEGWECVVVCNGPVTAEVQEALGECVSLDSRVRLEPLPSRESPARARNHAVAVSRAPYVANVSPDAISEPDRFLSQLLMFQDFPEITACGTWARVLDQEFHIVGARRYPAEPEEIASRLWQDSPTAEASMMYRREEAAYPEDIPESTSHTAAYAHLVRLVVSGKTVVNLPQFLVASCEPERPECAGWRNARAHMRSRWQAARLLPAWKRLLVLPFILAFPATCVMPLGMWRHLRGVRDYLLG